jgi:hypothetical protein
MIYIYYILHVLCLEINDEDPQNAWELVQESMQNIKGMG